VTTPRARRKKIPRDPDDDYTPEAAEARRAFLRGQTGVGLEHVSQYSSEPSVLPGNIEHFTGVAQVPIGIAGPPRFTVRALGDFSAWALAPAG
jgi:hydroxymethylglutaryl-CoA reductase (NADPH)